MKDLQDLTLPHSDTHLPTLLTQKDRDVLVAETVQNSSTGQALVTIKKGIGGVLGVGSKGTVVEKDGSGGGGGGGVGGRGKGGEAMAVGAPPKGKGKAIVSPPKGILSPPKGLKPAPFPSNPSVSLPSDDSVTSSITSRSSRSKNPPATRTSSATSMSLLSSSTVSTSSSNAQANDLSLEAAQTHRGGEEVPAAAAAAAAVEKKRGTINCACGWESVCAVESPMCSLPSAALLIFVNSPSIDFRKINVTLSTPFSFEVQRS